MKMKIKALGISVLVIVLACVSAGTLAYFTAEDTAHNVITSGGVDIELIEKTDNDEDWPEEGVSGVMPGNEITKRVSIKNVGGNSAWVRIKVNVDMQLADGISGEVDKSYIIINYDDENWTEKDGYWYYNKMLEHDEETLPLFTNVTFDKEMGNMYQNSKVYIDVAAQAVQCANNGDTVMDANGWPVAE